MAIFEKIRILFLCFLAIVVLISVLSSEEVSDNNTIEVIGHLKEIKEIVPRRNRSLHYNLYIQESAQLYKVSPDWALCFKYDEFRRKNKSGDLIKMKVNKDNGMKSNSFKEVVSLTSKDITFLSSNCVNKQIQNTKIGLPLFLILGAGFIWGLIWIIKNKTPESK